MQQLKQKFHNLKLKVMQLEITVQAFAAATVNRLLEGENVARVSSNVFRFAKYGKNQQKRLDALRSRIETMLDNNLVGYYSYYV